MRPMGLGSRGLRVLRPSKISLVAEWIHFTLLGIILPTIKLKVYTFLGLTRLGCR